VAQLVATSISDGVTGIFHSLDPSGRTMGLASTQPLTEMSTRSISWWLKAADPYHLHVPIVLNLNFLEPSGPVQACTRITSSMRTNVNCTLC
jgi:hypothetical protein